MTINCVAIMAPGDMGAGVGRALRDHGMDAITCLAGRSPRTRALAQGAGLRDVASLDALVGQADMVLSILPPARAVRQARDMAAAMVRTHAKPVYVDCNAVSPGTLREAARAVEAVGAPFIDCGIIGLKPGPNDTPRFYVSGPVTAPMEALDGMGIEVIAMGDGIGRASGMKMAYAALTKGTWTLHTAVLMAARRMDLFDDLIAEFEHSQPAPLKAMRARVPRLPADSARWIGEMEEIAKTFREAGVTGAFHDGAADVFRVLAATPYASETRESFDAGRSMEQSVREYVRHLAEAAE